MRRLLAFALLVFGTSPAVAESVEDSLVGTWKLDSYYSEIRSTGEKKNNFGEKPRGYLIFTPQKRMMAVLTAEQRAKPETDQDRVAAFTSMFAYSGQYRVEADKWITKVDVAWNEKWMGTDQVRFFKLDGDKLTVTSMWQPSVTLPGKVEARGVTSWSRVKSSNR
jgi:hypothetical protein